MWSMKLKLPFSNIQRAVRPAITNSNPLGSSHVRSLGFPFHKRYYYVKPSLLNNNPCMSLRSCKLIDNSRRNFSTESDNTKIETNAHQNDQNIIPIYKRHPKRTLFPRGLLMASSAHCAYWVWYVLDFTPAVNSSNIEALHVDPTMGYIGFILSGFMLGAAGLYPRYLIGEIAYDKKQKVKLVKCFSLPFVRLDNSKNQIQIPTNMKVKMDAEPKRMTNMAQHQIFPSGHVPIQVQDMKGFLLLDIDQRIDYNEILDESNLQSFLMGWSISSSNKSNLIKGKNAKHNDKAAARQLALKKRIIRRRGRN